MALNAHSSTAISPPKWPQTSKFISVRDFQIFFALISRPDTISRMILLSAACLRIFLVSLFQKTFENMILPHASASVLKMAHQYQLPKSTKRRAGNPICLHKSPSIKLQTSISRSMARYPQIYLENERSWTQLTHDFANCKSEIDILYRLSILSAEHNARDALWKTGRTLKIPLMFPCRNIGLSCMTFDKVTLGLLGYKAEASSILQASLPKGVLKKHGNFPKCGRVLRSDNLRGQVKSFKTDGTRILSTVVVAEEAFQTRGKLKPRSKQLDILPNRGMFYLGDICPEAISEALDGREPVGTDPGVKSLVTCSNKMEMTLEEYRSIQGAAKSKRRQDQHQADQIAELPSLKCSSVESLLTSLRYRQRKWSEFMGTLWWKMVSTGQVPTTAITSTSSANDN